MFNPSIKNPQRLYNLSIPEYQRREYVVDNPYTNNVMKTGIDKPLNYMTFNQTDYCSIRWENPEEQANSNYNHYKECMKTFSSLNTNPTIDDYQTETQRQYQLVTQYPKTNMFDITQYRDVDPKFNVKYNVEKQIRPIMEKPIPIQSDSKNVIVDKTQQPYSETRTIPNTATKEYFNQASLDDTDILYKSMLRSYSIAICDYLNSNPKYSHWIKNWKILEKNIKKTDLKMDRLEDHDKEIAYTENKGDIIKFRWRDNLKYLPRSIFCYVLLHELTHQVFPPSFIGHKSPFPEMLCLLCVAGYELRLFDLKNIPLDMVKSNGQPITSRKSISDEILFGINMLETVNPDSKQYYNQLRRCVYTDLHA